MHVFLETQRLALRRFSVDDADNLVNLDADPDVMRFVTGGIPTSRDEIENEVLPAFLGYYEQYEGFGFWAVIEKATGEFLGWFHLRSRPDAVPGEVELGYRLRKSAWGKGYATEGSRALIRKGFAELGVQRVVAEAMAVNMALRRCRTLAIADLHAGVNQRKAPGPMKSAFGRGESLRAGSALIRSTRELINLVLQVNDMIRSVVNQSREPMY